MTRLIPFLLILACKPEPPFCYSAFSGCSGSTVDFCCTINAAGLPEDCYYHVMPEDVEFGCSDAGCSDGAANVQDYCDGGT